MHHSTLSWRLALILGFAVGIRISVQAQVINLDDTTAPPTQGVGHDFIKMFNETVNPANGSLSLRIELPVPEARGLQIPVSELYNSSGVAHVIPACCGSQGGIWVTDTQLTNGSGWSYTIPTMTAALGVASFYNGTAEPPYTATCTYISSYVFQDLNGTAHSLPLSIAQSYSGGAGNCSELQGQGFPQNYLSGSDDFFQAATTGVCSSCIPQNPNAVTVAGPDGTVYQFPSFSSNDAFGTISFWSYANSIEDRNGNIASLGASRGTNGVMSLGVTDTLGRSVVSASSLSGNTNTISVSGVSGQYTQTWETVNFSFAVTSTGIGNVPCGSGTIGKAVGSNYVIKAITLPNRQAYQFSYDSTYGLLSQIQYPSGGYVSYQWGLNPQSEQIGVLGPPGEGNPVTCDVVYDYPAITQRTVSYDGVHVAEQQTFTYSTNWSGSPWKQTTVKTTDSVRGTSYQTIYTYTPTVMQPTPPNVGGTVPSYIPMEQSVVKQDFSGAVLETDYKQWLDTFLLSCELNQLDNNSSLISGKWYTYGSGGQLTDTKEYDYGLVTNTTACSGPAPSNPTREVSTAYQSFPSTKIFASAPSIFNRPYIIQTKGGGTLMAETDYAYDGTSVTCNSVNGCVASSLTGHDGTNYSTTNNNRGNATTKTVKCLQSGCANAVTTYTYDEAGQITSMIDPCGNGTCSDMSGSNHTTTYSYGNSFTTLSGGTNQSYAPSGNADAYITQITDPLGHIRNFSYDWYSGEVTVSQNQNDINANRTGTAYLYNDTFSRPTLTTYPDGGQTAHAYSDAAPSPTVTTCQLISGTAGATCLASSPPPGWKVDEVTMDGMDHPVQTELVSDPDTPTFTATTYDGLGHIYTQSNPYRSSSSPTDGTTTYTYDALGRTVSVARPDGSQVQTSYSGNCSTVADEVGAIRMSCADSFGRLTQVQEPGTGGQNETAGSAVITIGGSEQSATVKAMPGTGTVTAYGSEQQTTYYPCGTSSCPTTLWDQGTVTVTVNGYTAYGSYGQGSTSSTVAQTLLTTSALNSSQSPVTATLNGSVITLTAKTSGTSTNYTVSASASTNYPQYFSGASFTLSPSGSTLTGGQNAGTMYDSGSVSLIVDNSPYTVSYGQGSTPSSIASALASALNSGSSVLASTSGGTITLSADDVGSASNYPLSSSVAWNTEDFTQASFTVSAPSTLTGGSSGTLGTGPLVTIYTYDALNNLTCAVQKGTDTTGFTSCSAASSTWRPRSFVYDSLSRLTSATNPESGNITYTYDVNSNLSSRVTPKVGQIGTATTTHSYTYDVENRLLSETHAYASDGTDKYAYDGSANLTGCGQNPPSITATNLVHNRSQMCGDHSGSSWSYDPMGRPVLESRINTAPSIVQQKYSVGYSYFADGSLQTLTYPSGDVVTYKIGDAGRPIQASDPNNVFATSVTYSPHGAIVGMNSGTGPIVTNNIYNNRLQPTLLSAGASGASPFFNLCYDFHSGTAINVTAPNGALCSFSRYGTGNNGNVFQVVNNVDATRSAVFQYDLLNRVSKANTTNTTSSNCWGEVYTTDYWGNLTNISGASGMGSCWTETLNAAPASTANQLGGYCYDAAGNLSLLGACPTGSFTPTWAYDAENRLSSTAGYSYYYDADGVRMEKANGSSGTMYWPGPSGEYLTETSISGTINEEYVYLNGKRIARVDRPSGTAHYYFSDHLGSTGVITDPTGTEVQEAYYYYPYGGLVSSSGSDPNHYKFTGKERDSESGLDNFGARYNTSSLGRFMTPDPSPNGIAPGDPQSWNLYSYVRNRPTRSVDIGGDWATDVHAEIVTVALQGLVSAGELKQLVAEQYVMDKNQAPEFQYRHAMSNGQSNPPQSAEEASNKMWDYVATMMGGASATLGPNGQFNSVSLAYLGDAIHTVEDYTSPMHTSPSGEPLPWYGASHGGFQHWQGENSPSDSWAGFGQAVRLTMAVFMQVNPELAKKKGLTEATFNAEADRRISQYVENFFRMSGNVMSSDSIKKDMARQCALGNPAACDH